MKTKIIISLVILALAGCATPPPGAYVVHDPNQLPPIQQAYANRLSRLQIGTPIATFKSIFPEAYVGGQNGATTAYELVRTVNYVTQGDIDRQNFWWGVGSPNARSARQVLWFYFYGDRLVKWGKPGDWPASPDKIIEVRPR